MNTFKRSAGPQTGLTALREFGLDLLALMWPSSCASCGAPDRELCATCLAALREGGKAPWLPIPGLGVPGYAAGAYAGELRAALLAYKNRGARAPLRVLGRRLAVPLRAAAYAEYRSGAPDPPHVVVLPSRARRVRERGFKHVDELVRIAGRGSALRLDRRSALRALRGRTGQVGLDALARETNAARVRVVARHARILRGKTVILVDDIVTTGATVRAAIAVLAAQNVRVVAVVSLCFSLRRDSSKN